MPGSYQTNGNDPDYAHTQAKLFEKADLVGSGLYSFIYNEFTEEEVLEQIKAQNQTELESQRTRLDTSLSRLNDGVNNVGQEALNRVVKLYGPKKNAVFTQQSDLQEIGQMLLSIKLKLESFEFQLFSEAKQIEKHLYDPFCLDEHIYKHHLEKV